MRARPRLGRVEVTSKTWVSPEWFTYVLYFGYMTLIALGLFLLTGAAGFFACLWFTKKIYASIKVD